MYHENLVDKFLVTLINILNVIRGISLSQRVYTLSLAKTTFFSSYEELHTHIHHT